MLLFCACVPVMGCVLCSLCAVVCREFTAVVSTARLALDDSVGGRHRRQRSHRDRHLLQWRLRTSSTQPHCHWKLYTRRRTYINLFANDAAA